MAGHGVSSRAARRIHVMLRFEFLKVTRGWTLRLSYQATFLVLDAAQRAIYLSGLKDQDCEQH